MSSERESIRALAEEANETVTLTREFYSCVVKDPRTKSGEFKAAKPAPLPVIEEPVEKKAQKH